jgi:hypothetical protein
MNSQMLREATGCNENQISASLYELRHYRAVDFILNPDGKGWWYARPPEEDTRLRVIVEIVDGIKRPRKSQKVTL